MKILFLDDDEQRHSHYQKVSIGHEVRHVRTALAAIAALRKLGPYDVADLDHDLGGQHMVSFENKGHGGEVARYIAEHPETVKRVIVHSYNEPAAMKMCSLLRQANVDVTWYPFCEWYPNLDAVFDALKQGVS